MAILHFWRTTAGSMPKGRQGRAARKQARAHEREMQRQADARARQRCEATSSEDEDGDYSCEPNSCIQCFEMLKEEYFHRGGWFDDPLGPLCKRCFYDMVDKGACDESDSNSDGLPTPARRGCEEAQGRERVTVDRQEAKETAQRDAAEETQQTDRACGSARREEDLDRAARRPDVGERARCINNEVQVEDDRLRKERLRDELQAVSATTMARQEAAKDAARRDVKDDAQDSARSAPPMPVKETECEEKVAHHEAVDTARRGPLEACTSDGDELRQGSGQEQLRYEANLARRARGDTRDGALVAPVIHIDMEAVRCTRLMGCDEDELDQHLGEERLRYEATETARHAAQERQQGAQRRKEELARRVAEEKARYEATLREQHEVELLEAIAHAEATLLGEQAAEDRRRWQALTEARREAEARYEANLVRCKARQEAEEAARRMADEWRRFEAAEAALCEAEKRYEATVARRAPVRLHRKGTDALTSGMDKENDSPEVKNVQEQTGNNNNADTLRDIEVLRRQRSEKGRARREAKAQRQAHYIDS